MRKPKFKDDDLVEAIQPCAITVEGVDYIFNPGRQKIRAIHPAVKHNPDLFQAVDPKTAEGE